MTSCLLKILIGGFIVYQQAYIGAAGPLEELAITTLVEHCATEHNVTLEQIGVNGTIKSVGELHELYKKILDEQKDKLPPGVGNCVVGCVYNKLGYTLSNGKLVLTPFGPVDENRKSRVMLLEIILNVMCKNYTTSMCDVADCLVRNFGVNLTIIG